MQISDNGIDLLKQFEGCKLSPYMDSGGKVTIGYGHLVTEREKATGKIAIVGDQVNYKFGINDDQAKALLRQDMKPAMDAVNKIIEPLNQNQYDALVIFTFNIGVGAFVGSHVFSEADEGNFQLVPKFMAMWTHVKGVTNKGLVNRRQAEIDLWNKAV